MAAIALIGHDALMTTNTHAGPIEVVSADAHHRIADDESATRSDQVVGGLVQEQNPHGSDACDVARPILQPNDSEFSTITQAPTSSLNIEVKTPPSQLARPPLVEPTAPPGVRRALFQVFLI